MLRFFTIAMTVAAAAVGLVACGSDNNSPSDTGAQTTGATTDTTTTGKTGTTTDKKSGSSGKRRHKRKKSGSSGSKTTSTGTSKPKSVSTGTSDLPTTSVPKRKSKTQPPLSPGNVKGTAKRVCSTFLPTRVEKDLKRGKTTKQKVARNYAKGYAKSQQDDAYQGCLAGLKTRAG